jgi:hypothetical protein
MAIFYLGEQSRTDKTAAYVIVPVALSPVGSSMARIGAIDAVRMPLRVCGGDAV